MVNEIIGQALGYAAAALFAISYQIKKNTPLIIIQTVGTTLFCLSYLFLGQMDGFAINIVCIIRNLSFCILKPKTRLCYTVTGILMAAMSVVSIFSWEGPISLLIFLPLIINTFFLSLGNPQTLRKSVVFTSSGLLLYNIFVMLWGGIISESISITSSIVGIIRYRRTDGDAASTEANTASNDAGAADAPDGKATADAGAE